MSFIGVEEQEDRATLNGGKGAADKTAKNSGGKDNLQNAVEIENYNAQSGGKAEKGAESDNAENITKQEKSTCGNTLYLVTGAHGFIGREVCRQLCAQGKRVRALIRKKRDDITLPPEAEICTGDLLNTSSLERFFQDNCGEIIVIHCAAVISVKKKSKACVNANVCGTQNIIDFCLKYKARKLVYLGSVDGIFAKKGEIVEEPSEYLPHLLKTDYAKSKAQSCAMVLAAQTHEFETAAVLPSAVIGPYDYKEGFITHILKIYTKGLLPPFSVKGGYDFVDVRDVAAAVINACEQGKKGSYIISNEYLSMTQVFDAFAHRLDRKPTLKTFPMGVLYPLAAVASFFNLFNKGEPILTFSALDIMKNSPSYSHKKATTELDFHPRPLAETLNDTADYLRERVEKEKAARKNKK